MQEERPLLGGGPRLLPRRLPVVAVLSSLRLIARRDRLTVDLFFSMAIAAAPPHLPLKKAAPTSLPSVF
jgi:hypothetical protein